MNLYKLKWIPIIIGLLLFSQLFSMRLITLKKALQKLMPGEDKVEYVEKTLTPFQIQKIRSRMGGALVLYQEGSESGRVDARTDYFFYFGIKNGQRDAVAVVEEQPGKMGPVKFIVVLDSKSGKVINLAVLEYEESRGRSMARMNFLRQFLGLGSSDPIRVHQDIRAITGATISSKCACFAVKKAIVLYEEVFMNS